MFIKCLVLCFINVCCIFALGFNHAVFANKQINKYGGTLRLTHLGQDPKTLNPWISNDATSSEYAALLFEGLTINDPDTDEVIPHMAKSFEIFDNGKKIIARLRDDTFWTDGKQITADDVVYTWNDLLRDQVALSSLRDVLLVEGEFPKVTKVDNLTIAFETQKVFAPFLNVIGIAIAPKHDVEKYFRETGANSLEEKQKAFNNYLNVNSDPDKIICNGPFKLLKVKHGERIEFIRNLNYFLRDSEGNRLPYLDKVVYTYVQDSAADAFKFLAKESYLLRVSPENGAFIKSLEKKYDFTLHQEGPSTGTSFMWFNLSKNIPEPKYSWFNNNGFRQAISYAIDRQSVVNNVYQGLGSPLFTAESLKTPFLNEKLSKGYKRDLDKAKKMLLEAGFKYKGEKLLDKNGVPVEFNLFTNAGNKERELTSTIVMNNLKSIGIKVNFKALEFNNFVARITAGKDYDAGILGLTGSNEPNSGANVWKSDGRLHMFDVRSTNGSPEKINPVRDWEKEIDRLFEIGVQTMDFDSRKKIYDKFQEIVYEQNPFIYIASPNTMTAVSNKLGNIKNTKYRGVMPFLHDIYIKSL